MQIQAPQRVLVHDDNLRVAKMQCWLSELVRIAPEGKISNEISNEWRAEDPGLVTKYLSQDVTKSLVTDTDRYPILATGGCYCVQLPNLAMRTLIAVAEALCELLKVQQQGGGVVAFMRRYPHMRTLAEILGEELHAKVDWVAMQANLELLMEGFGHAEVLHQLHWKRDLSTSQMVMDLFSGRYQPDFAAWLSGEVEVYTPENATSSTDWPSIERQLLANRKHAATEELPMRWWWSMGCEHQAYHQTAKTGYEHRREWLLGMQRMTDQVASLKRQKVEAEMQDSPSRQQQILQKQAVSTTAQQLNDQVQLWATHSGGVGEHEGDDEAPLSSGSSDWTAAVTWYGKGQVDVDRLLNGMQVPVKWWVHTSLHVDVAKVRGRGVMQGTLC